MKIKNQHIQHFGNFLVTLRLKGQESRMRTRFIKKLQQQLDMINKEQDEIIKEYAKYDEEGNVQKRKEGDKEFYVIDDTEMCEREIKELLNEDFVVEENEENKLMLLTVKNALLNCDMEFEGEDAFKYDLYCEIFESIYQEVIEAELAN